MIRSVFIQLFSFIVIAFLCNDAAAQVTIKFNVIANGKMLVLNDSTYTNSYDEKYQVSRLKYYISNMELSGFTGGAPAFFPNEIFLIDAGHTDSLTISAPSGRYRLLRFNIGVDSALNCSGAQAGALDPLNGMFWTWNSGYIFFKLEGYSPASTADLQRIEHHVGGYRYPYNVYTPISCLLPVNMDITAGSKHIITVNVDLDEYWRSNKIADLPLLMTPGPLAMRATDNFPEMFRIKSVQ